MGLSSLSSGTVEIVSDASLLTPPSTNLKKTVESEDTFAVARDCGYAGAVNASALTTPSQPIEPLTLHM